MKHAVKSFLDRLGLLKPAFRLHEALQAMSPAAPQDRYQHDLAPDGLPIPPGRLIVQVFGQNNAAAYLEGGRLLAQSIRETLQLRDLRLEDFGTVLDFGCGCGRIIRHWKPIAASTRLHGADYNAGMIAWCTQNLPFAQYQVNDFLPPLKYPDRSFDLVYAVSVFTHLSEAAQSAWIHELARVIRPAGYLLITVHGESFAEALTPAERARFEAGELVVRYDSVAGTNLCAAFHPPEYVAKLGQARFSMLERVTRQAEQELILFQRLAA
jgi:SAM-dependent methyltransferase